MTKIAFVADVHLGNHKIHGGEPVASLNERCRVGLGTFQRAVDRAIDLGCASFVVLGDLFDYQRPEAQLLAAVQRILARADTEGVRVFLLVGNHDQTSSARGDHALGPLSPYASVIEAPTNVLGGPGVRLGLVPFVSGGVPGWFGDAVKEAARVGSGVDYDVMLLGVHLGIADEETPPWLVKSDDAIRFDVLQEHARKLGFSKALAGNWHNRKRWKGPPEVFQLGALVPTGWDNPGLEGYGTLAVWDDGDLSYEEIAGPRFLGTTPDDAPELVAEAKRRGHVPLVRLVVPPDQLATARASLDALGVVGDVHPDAFDTTVAARTAATNARAATTVDDALAGFVGAMVLPEGVDRAAVLSKAKGYLRRGD
jgi:hypothetical protein